MVLITIFGLLLLMLPTTIQAELANPDGLLFELTSGNPTGAEQNIDYYISNEWPAEYGSPTIHSYTWQELNNGYFRFTMDYTVPAGLSVYVFNPSNGDLISMWSSGTTSGGRDTLQFDILSDMLQAAEGVNVNFYSGDGSCFVYFNTESLFSQQPSGPPAFDLTTGTPSGTEYSINYMINNFLPNGSAPVIHSYTYQELNNGCLRFTMDYTMPQGLSVFVFDPPNGDLINMDGSGITSGDRNTLQFDIPLDTLQATEGLNVNFYAGDDSCFIYFSKDSLFSQQPSGGPRFNLTDGTPAGTVHDCDYTMYDTLPDGHAPATIHSYTCQELDNGCLRFTMGYTMPQGLSVSVSDPPNGERISMDGSGTTSGSRDTIQFDIQADKLQTAESFNVSFYDQNGEYIVFLRTGSLFPVTTSLFEFNLTNGTPAGGIEDVGFDLGRMNVTPNMAGTIHSCTSQELDNGYTRFTVRFTVIPGLWLRATDRPGVNVLFSDSSIVTSGQSSVLQFDISNEDLAVTSAVQIIFIHGPGSPRSGYAFGLLICPHADTPDPSQTTIAIHPTGGNPDGDIKSIPVYEVNHWNSRIYDGTRQHLDNGHTRFTFRISLSNNCYIRVTREGMLFDYYTAKVEATPANTKLQVDIPDSNLSGLDTFSIHFYRENIYYLNASVQCNSNHFDLADMDVLYLPESLTTIQMNAFENNACEAVVIPEECQSVGSHAFRNCKNLQYVRMPYDLEIAPDAFEGCGQVQFERIGSE
jgi:hypothetical protein